MWRLKIVAVVGVALVETARAAADAGKPATTRRPFGGALGGRHQRRWTLPQAQTAVVHKIRGGAVIQRGLQQRKQRPVATRITGGSGDGVLTPGELVACVMADLCPHGMLPLAWASVAGAGMGSIPAVALVIVFGALAAYTLYLSALVADAGRASHKPRQNPRHRAPGPPSRPAIVAHRPPPSPPPPPSFTPPPPPPAPAVPAPAVPAAVPAPVPAVPSEHHTTMPSVVEDAPPTSLSSFATMSIPPQSHGGEPRRSEALSSIWTAAGLPGARVVDVGVAALCGGCCVFYAAFAADLFGALASRVLVSGGVLPRSAVLVALLAGPLAPLCLGDDLSVLKYSSYAGLAGVLYTALFVVFEALRRNGGGFGLDDAGLASSSFSWGPWGPWGFGASRSSSTSSSASSPPVLQGTSSFTHSGGGLHHGNGLPPSPFHTSGSGAAVLVSTLVVAFLCHYNAVAYYRELRPPTSPSEYAGVSAVAMAAVALVFAMVLLGGRAAFGGDAMPNLLNNLDASSTAGALAKLGTGVAILSGFPLMFAGLKSALDEAAKDALTQNRRLRRAVHIILLCAVGLVAALASDDDVGTIIELLGSTLGAAAVYVVPGLAAAATDTVPTVHRVAGGLVAGIGSLLGIASTLFLTLGPSDSH